MKKFNCILLVDDDETCNFITQKIITKLDISSHTYSTKNGREAMSFIEASSETVPVCPDLILLDLNMPVMDGIEFLEEFYANKKIKHADDINIYVLSSSDNIKDMEKVMKYKVKGYITKPMTADKLINIASC
ncbi:MAG TPA: response regulator [Cytophagaceae bacterium]|jgi:CheY-like chemotaxis protein|nr:response regulator [Cytophagaceae bacterium]